MDARPPVSGQQGGPSVKNAGKRRTADRAARGGEQQRRADPPSDKTQYLRTASPKHPHHFSSTVPDQREGPSKTSNTCIPVIPLHLHHKTAASRKRMGNARAEPRRTVDRRAAGKQQARQRSHEDQVRMTGNIDMRVAKKFTGWRKVIRGV
ncbi:Hypothetical predicted protein [Pelobates cultripes]|uniref:Uncharacterized protein n=1 Tax=Pelobates cultripes TaxID=61616 RepID=A0AAD1W658_PELCU|nr:Hypothetical predicted protein [Pelobates cultripes]